MFFPIIFTEHHYYFTFRILIFFVFILNSCFIYVVDLFWCKILYNFWNLIFQSITYWFGILFFITHKFVNVIFTFFLSISQTLSSHFFANFSHFHRACYSRTFWNLPLSSLSIFLLEIFQWPYSSRLFKLMCKGFRWS